MKQEINMQIMLYNIISIWKKKWVNNRVKRIINRLYRNTKIRNKISQALSRH